MDEEFLKVLFIFFIGVILGCFVGYSLTKIYLLQPYLKTEISDIEMILIFFRSSFIATFLCYAGAVFSLGEIWFYRRVSKKIYELLNKPWNLLRSLIFTLNVSERNAPYDSLHTLLFLTPTGGCVVIGLVFGVYLSIFSLKFGMLGMRMFFYGIFPHTFIEVPCYLISASLGLKIAKNLERMLGKKLQSFEGAVYNELNNSETLNKMVILYILLILSAFMEKFY
ncbi:MAG: stage II sporulation protein M [Candidatus Parvarchaeota archaeon]|nr:stage II sporulation protein M [Candidatus Jingweiarchaeum tengchongense]MCW1298305.1 stage II sporulation protein M [Candidatus Jingweiarchaeum tengchongense]MCW1300396.1 stage II sporulation protein M [Candidatus Jingweiarchaeum tengchongense]MCW1304759.1 stage II sporulation protein M [Candidatus Jingweiarchaeum tengchongense]MCW1305349.1 stage II sporulation protein M [Candidatus Jingweiarchaeum tengchongense]